MSIDPASLNVNRDGLDFHSLSDQGGEVESGNLHGREVVVNPGTDNSTQPTLRPDPQPNTSQSRSFRCRFRPITCSECCYCLFTVTLTAIFFGAVASMK